MEISVYDVHHIFAKYLNLRQHVFIVSDWLVFFCSFLCCQCGEYLAQNMPVDGLSEVSSVMYQITPQKLEVSSTVQSNEDMFKHLQLGEEAAESEMKCTELWSLVDKPRELDGKIEPDNYLEPLLTLTDSLLEIPSPAANRSNDYPTVHSHKRPQQQHQMSEA